MRTSATLVLIACGLIIIATSCERHTGAPPSESETVAEGVIYYVEYKLEDGKSGGFTRVNDFRSVPGHNGSWNVDAYGRLTREYLIITRPQQRDLGVRVIPAHRLLDIQFGDGGIKEVDENQPAKTK